MGSAGLLHAFSSKLSLNFKLIFESKGSKNEDFAATQNRSDPSILIKGTIINKIKPTYISFAPLLRYHIGSTKLFIEGGPYISYLLSAVWDIETSFSDPAYNYHTFFNMQNDDEQNNEYVRHGPILMQHDDGRNAVTPQYEEDGAGRNVRHEGNVDIIKVRRVCGA